MHIRAVKVMKKAISYAKWIYSCNCAPGDNTYLFKTIHVHEAQRLSWLPDIGASVQKADFGLTLMRKYLPILHSQHELKIIMKAVTPLGHMSNHIMIWSLCSVTFFIQYATNLVLNYNDKIPVFNCFVYKKPNTLSSQYKATRQKLCMSILCKNISQRYGTVSPDWSVWHLLACHPL